MAGHRGRAAAADRGEIVAAATWCKKPISSGAKRTLRGAKAIEPPARLPTQAELNVPSRVPARIQAQRATLKRTVTQDNLKQVKLYAY